MFCVGFRKLARERVAGPWILCREVLPVPLINNLYEVRISADRIICPTLGVRVRASAACTPAAYGGG